MTTSYNCECEDGNPNVDTLDNLRRRIAIRMGYSAQSSYLPEGKPDEIDDYLRSAQEFLYDKVASFRQSRFFKWPLVQGVRFYDFDANSDECSKKMRPELVEWVGVSDGDDETNERWNELICGIPPELYTGGQHESWPYRYEFRQCIEVWPAPDERAGFLRIKAKFGLQPFEADSDTTTIDAELVFMLALANMRMDYNKPGAQSYMGQVQSRIGDLIAASHHTRRYITDDPVLPCPPEPKLVGGYEPSA